MLCFRLPSLIIKGGTWAQANLRSFERVVDDFKGPKYENLVVFLDGISKNAVGVYTE